MLYRSNFIINLVIGYQKGIYSEDILNRYKDILNIKTLYEALDAACRQRIGYAFLSALKKLSYSAKGSIKYIISIFLKDVEYILQNERNYLNKVTKTIKYVYDCLERYDIPFIFLKTVREIPYNAPDVDIFIPQSYIDEVNKIFYRRGFKVKRFSKAEFRLYHKGLVRIDFYNSLIYLGIRFNNIEEIIFKEKRYINIDDVSIPIPNEFGSLCINVLHSSLGHNMINLIDFIDTLILINHLKNNFLKKVYDSKIDIIIFTLLKDYIKCCTSLEAEGFKKRKLNIPKPFRSKEMMKLNLNFTKKLFHNFYYLQSIYLNFAYYYALKEKMPLNIRLIIQKIFFLEKQLSKDEHIQGIKI